MGEGQRNNPLRRVAELFELVGWNKRLVDLTEDEVVGLVMIAQKNTRKRRLFRAKEEEMKRRISPKKTQQPSFCRAR